MEVEKWPQAPTPHLFFGQQLGTMKSKVVHYNSQLHVWLTKLEFLGKSPTCEEEGERRQVGGDKQDKTKGKIGSQLKEPIK